MLVTELDTSQYPHCITGTPTESHSKRSTHTLHLSRIYRDLEEQALLKRHREAAPDELDWYAAGGYLWEREFSAMHADAVTDGNPDLVRPDEFEMDGITGSPDVIRVNEWRVVELKFRWMSAHKFDQLEKWFWTELVQVKGYCKLIGSQTAELVVFFVNGDYCPPRPMVRGVLLEFTEQEIEESWRMIKNHAQRRGWL